MKQDNGNLQTAESFEQIERYNCQLIQHIGYKYDSCPGRGPRLMSRLSRKNFGMPRLSRPKLGMSRLWRPTPDISRLFLP